MMKATDEIGRSVIALATLRGRKSTLEAVITAVMEILDQTEVCHPLYFIDGKVFLSSKYVTLTLPS